LRNRRYFDASVTIFLGTVCDLARVNMGRGTMSDDIVSLEDMLAIERVAQELWEQATKRSPAEWQSLSVLAKQAWRNRAQIEVTFWRKSVGAP
jgi:hypothetical protein